MVTTSLIISIPITALIIGFLVLKSVQLGLKWQMQITSKQEPSLSIPNPIQQVKDSINQSKQSKQIDMTNSVLDEWLNGAKEGE